MAPEPPPGQVQVQELRRAGSKERGRGLLTPAGLGSWWRPPGGGRRRVSSSSSSSLWSSLHSGDWAAAECGPSFMQSFSQNFPGRRFPVRGVTGNVESSAVLWPHCAATCSPLLALVTRLLLQDPLPTLRTPEQGSPRHEVWNIYTLQDLKEWHIKILTRKEPANLR